MRNPTLAGADGPANVLAAIQVAAHTDSRRPPRRPPHATVDDDTVKAQEESINARD